MAANDAHAVPTGTAGKGVAVAGSSGGGFAEGEDGARWLPSSRARMQAKHTEP